MPTYTKPTDTAHKIKLESHLIYALWSHKCAHAGQEAGFEVKTSLVGNGAKIEITCKNESGKKLEKVDGVIFNNKISGSVLIPEKVKPDDMLFFEAKLPKHGLKGESNSIPARPPITVTKMQWDRTEVNRKDTVKMTCQFTNGVEDGDDAEILIYEHNPNSCDIKVVSIRTVINDNKIEVEWEFDYQDDTVQIPTEDDMNPYQKNYINPQFYFVVVVDGIKIGENMESGLMKFKDWVDFKLRCGGKDWEGTKCVLTLPDGKTEEIALDKDGKIRKEDVPPGPYKISFPDMMPEEE
jgi:hypothetical protein